MTSAELQSRNGLKIFQEDAIYFVEDSTTTILADHLTNILMNIREKNDKFHLLWSVIFAVALECGFRCYNSTDLNLLPVNYTNLDDEVFEIILILNNNVKNMLDITRDEQFQLMGLKNGESLIITFVSFKSIRTSFSVYLPLSTYIPLISKNNFAKSFRYLDELSRLLKTNLFLPVRNYYTGETGRNPSLLFIDPYSFMNILRYLKLEDKNKMALTCKRLYHRIKNNE